MDLTELLGEAKKLNASDLHGKKACLKIRGRWISPLESRHWAGSGLMPSARGEQLQQHSVW